MAKDPYTTLGIARGASEADIKKAYRKLAKELHPDRTKNDPRASERFKDVSAAYAILSDADKRAKFDRGEIGADGEVRSPFDRAYQERRGQHAYSSSGFESDPLDLFAQFFGGGAGKARRGAQTESGFESDFGQRAGGAARKGRNIEYDLAVPFEGAARLDPQRINLKSGKTIELKLPPGFVDGQQLRLGGQGEKGAGGAGDALITLTVANHPWFTRDGDHVLLDLPVRLDEAVLGAKIKVPTVDGPVMLAVPAGSSSGKILRLRGKGFTMKDGSRGDQLVTLLVDIGTPDPELTKFAQTWAGAKRQTPRKRWGLE